MRKGEEGKVKEDEEKVGVGAARRSVEVAKAGRAKFQRRDVSTEFQST